jgi:hypothetical protein
MDQINNHPLYRIHTIDSAMSSLWDFYTKRFISLFIISFVMGLTLQYLSSLIKIDIADYQTFNIEEMMLKLRDYLWPMLIVSLSGLLFTTVLHYYIIYNPLDRDNNIFRCLLKSLRYYIPYIIILVFLAVAGSFALFLGLLVLVIGILFAAIYIFTIYLFILPVMLVEGPGIANTMSRTITLSHRNFWANIGWTAVFVIILLVISAVLSGFILLPFTGSFFKAFRDPGEAASLMDITQRPLYIIISAVISAVTMPFMPIFACILYFNGRAREEKGSHREVPENEEGDKVRVEDLYSKPLPEEEK